MDRSSFTALVRRYDDRLRGVAYRLLAGNADRVDDTLQDAYLRAYVSFAQFRGDADAGTWLYRIVTNPAWTSCAVSHGDPCRWTPWGGRARAR